MIRGVVAEMSYTLLSEVTRTARKRHRCIWCWQTIEPSERYISEQSVNYGDFQNNHWHPECRDAMLEESSNEGGYIEWTPGMERPLTAATLEYQSWNCAALAQGRLL